MDVEHGDSMPEPVAAPRQQIESSSDASPPNDTRWRETADAGPEWNALVATHLSALRASAKRLCQNSFDSDDIVQLTLMRAMRAHHQLRDQTRVLPWLLTILQRVFCDENRRRRRQRSVSLDEEHEIAMHPHPIEPLPWEHITDDDLHAAIAGLPDDVRDTYRLFAVERRSYAEISRRFGVPERTVGTRIHRARKRLRELLKATEKVR
jgi:RNA polymerase sigma-70 factor (ECF subfamily)